MMTKNIQGRYMLSETVSIPGPPLSRQQLFVHASKNNYSSNSITYSVLCSPISGDGDESSMSHRTYGRDGDSFKAAVAAVGQGVAGDGSAGDGSAGDGSAGDGAGDGNSDGNSDGNGDGDGDGASAVSLEEESANASAVTMTHHYDSSAVTTLQTATTITQQRQLQGPSSSSAAFFDESQQRQCPEFYADGA